MSLFSVVYLPELPLISYYWMGSANLVLPSIQYPWLSRPWWIISARTTGVQVGPTLVLHLYLQTEMEWRRVFVVECDGSSRTKGRNVCTTLWIRGLSEDKSSLHSTFKFQCLVLILTMVKMSLWVSLLQSYPNSLCCWHEGRKLFSDFTTCSAIAKVVWFHMRFFMEEHGRMWWLSRITSAIKMICWKDTWSCRRVNLSILHTHCPYSIFFSDDISQSCCGVWVFPSSALHNGAAHRI